MKTLKTLVSDMLKPAATDFDISYTNNSHDLEAAIFILPTYVHFHQQMNITSCTICKGFQQEASTSNTQWQSKSLPS